MRRSRFLVTASAVVAFALVAAACGDDDDTGSETTEPVPEATTAPAETTAAAETTATDETAAAEQTIQVGFAWPDLSAFEQVSAAYGVGEQEQQFLAVLEAWRADGTLPINGIDIEPVFQSFDALDP